MLISKQKLSKSLIGVHFCIWRLKKSTKVFRKGSPLISDELSADVKILVYGTDKAGFSCLRSNKCIEEIKFFG